MATSLQRLFRLTNPMPTPVFDLTLKLQFQSGVSLKFCSPPILERIGCKFAPTMSEMRNTVNVIPPEGGNYVSKQGGDQRSPIQVVPSNPGASASDSFHSSLSAKMIDTGNLPNQFVDVPWQGFFASVAFVV
jgi:hypothetical protein